MHKVFALLLGLGLATSLAQAQPAHTTAPDAFRHIPDLELARLSTGPKTLTLGTLTDHENFYVLVAGRSGPGEVEVHEHWADYMVIQQGEAEFTSGGTVTGMHDTAPGERRGGTITGGKVVQLKAGDFLMVPAGQPHVTMIKPGSPFRAIVFKQRQ